jgi:hypothetical protein
MPDAGVSRKSVNGTGTFFENEVFHPSVGKLLTGLAKQYHQHNPLDLFDINIRRFQREQAVDENLTLLRGQDADLLEVGNITTTCRVEALLLEIIVDAGTV